jgi:8-oxo-dGTP pyrophosphatase MutT (NUDIX family)
MEHPGEIWQEFDYTGERLGGLEPDKFDPSKVRLYGGVAVMFYRVRNGEMELLFQHRSKTLRDNPDKWDVSAGGHINLNEPRIAAALRETSEEIGVKLSEKELEFAGTYVRWNVMITLYFYDWGERDDEFSFDDAEVEEVKWVKYSELGDFLPNLKKHVNDDKMFLLCLDELNRRVLEKHGNN